MVGKSSIQTDLTYTNVTFLETQTIQDLSFEKVIYLKYPFPNRFINVAFLSFCYPTNTMQTKNRNLS